MAHIYEYGKKDRRRLERRVSVLPGVQAELDKKRFEIAVRAEALLLQHRKEGVSEIDVEDGHVDKYVILQDSFKTKREAKKLGNVNSALSIEFGHGMVVQKRTDKNGAEFEVIIPAHDGLHILGRAANLPKTKRGKKEKLD
ncbi:DUF5403 family protein [Actinacidiphila glaucinigra]|uniref:Uncharacterized protein n=1 Tax=Actinacidiphila glaucinigra TaxID=235986 RepID=A0A239F0F3_9ACTN|nr:DUF5403 family protein [Actinacidiphila glaucinigra]SNS50369.1 hypothetical protein SAMN05216252_106248 [Actinacidiphila glaucinigra]